LLSPRHKRNNPVTIIVLQFNKIDISKHLRDKHRRDQS
jgi:hypothetical protein